MPDGAVSDVMAILQQGLAQLQSDDVASASATFDQVLAREPDNFDALNLAGVAATRAKRYDDAVSLIERALAVRPEHAGALVNLGVAHRAARRPEQAAEAYRRAVAAAPAYAAAHANLASTLRELNYFEAALKTYDDALTLRPDHPETLVQRGLVLGRLQRQTQALASIDQAIALAPDVSRYHVERAKVLSHMRRHGEAMAAYKRAAELSPEEGDIAGPILWPKMKACSWEDRDELIGRVSGQVMSGKAAIIPFTSLLAFEDPALQLVAAQNHSRRLKVATPAIRSTASDRIRIGYFSADFKNHPMMHLMAEVLARHDRERFHVSAFAFNVGKGDDYTQLARESVDAYVDVDEMSDAEVAQMARERGIDIAIDRKGYTSGARTGIFARRAAPVQVNYLAYPGTMGADFIDYIVADRTIIPADAFQHYSEKVVWMPDSYAPRDTRTVVPDGADRTAAGLPEGAFVFCCFNQTSKITPEVFGNWMTILGQVENSVLWLFDDNPDAVENLKREAAARGLNPARLVFAAKEPQLQHLSRLRLADLCLDTLPYNAHTTANDALYVGVPIVTLPGETFASRVCASLLEAIDMPELIAADASKYVELAVALARDPERLAAVRARLAAGRGTARLYDMGRYVSAFETALTRMHERRLAGLPPDHIAVEL